MGAVGRKESQTFGFSTKVFRQVANRCHFSMRRAATGDAVSAIPKIKAIQAIAITDRAAKDQKPTLDCRHVPNASSLQWYKSQFVLCGPVKGQNHYGHKVFAQDRSAETDEELTVF